MIVNAFFTKPLGHVVCARCQRQWTNRVTVAEFLIVRNRGIRESTKWYKLWEKKLCTDGSKQDLAKTRFCTHMHAHYRYVWCRYRMHYWITFIIWFPSLTESGSIYLTPSLQSIVIPQLLRVSVSSFLLLFYTIHNCFVGPRQDRSLYSLDLSISVQHF